MSVAAREEPLWIDCAGDRMLGILSRPSDAGPHRSVGVLLAVGGPQYRAGSHRQFTLLARRLAAAGYPCLRFDFRGMGDSDGAVRGFEDVHDDMLAAIGALLANAADIERIVIWGLCDAASAALMFCATQPQVEGMVLLNPWARGDASHAQTTVKHYYRGRLMQASLWKKLLAGEMRLLDSVRDLLRNVRRAYLRRTDTAGSAPTDYRRAMAEGLRRFSGRVLLILSGNDLTAREFADHVRADPTWDGLLSRGNVQELKNPSADHTFSSAAWRAWVEEETLRWLDGVQAGIAHRRSTALEPRA